MSEQDQDRLDAETLAEFMEPEGWRFMPWPNDAWSVMFCGADGMVTKATDEATPWTRESIAPALAKIAEDEALWSRFCGEFGIDLHDVDCGYANGWKRMVTSDGPQLARACAAAVRGMR